MSKTASKMNSKSIEESELKASDGFNMSYRCIFPQKAKAAMILLHGMDIYSHMYVEAMIGLGKAGIICLAPDQRGRGKSTDEKWKSGEMPSITRIVQDVKELHRAYEHELNGLPLFFTGVCFGALISMLCMIEMPEKIRGIAIFGPPFGTKSGAIMKTLKIIGGAPLSPRTLRAWERLEKFGRDECQERIKEDAIFKNNPLRAAAAAQIISACDDIERMFAKMKVPLLIVYGREDKLVKRKQLDLIKSMWGSSDCSIVLLDNIGHDVLNEAKEARMKEIYFDWILERVKTL